MLEKKQSYISNYEMRYSASYLVTKLSNCVPTEWMNVALNRQDNEQDIYPNYLEDNL